MRYGFRDAGSCPSPAGVFEVVNSQSGLNGSRHQNSEDSEAFCEAAQGQKFQFPGRSSCLSRGDKGQYIARVTCTFCIFDCTCRLMGVHSNPLYMYMQVDSVDLQIGRQRDKWVDGQMDGWLG